MQFATVSQASYCENHTSVLAKCPFSPMQTHISLANSLHMVSLTHRLVGAYIGLSTSATAIASFHCSDQAGMQGSFA